jgi:hypothetical protein
MTWNWPFITMMALLAAFWAGVAFACWSMA